jgi:hypothetical protein
MLYNDLITYNQPSLNYYGALIINIDGISNPITIGNINVIQVSEEDYSNSSTIAIVSIDYTASGIMTIQVDSSQEAVVYQAIQAAQKSGEVLLQIGSQNSAEISQTESTMGGSGEIAVELI